MGRFLLNSFQNNRKFSKIYYQRQTKHGCIELYCFWLCYSLKLDVVYCEPCWLFSNIKQDQLCNQGICDWQHLTQKITMHENSYSHLTYYFVYEQWKQNKTINKKYRSTT